jgi:hypothetical protein
MDTMGAGLMMQEIEDTFSCAASGLLITDYQLLKIHYRIDLMRYLPVEMNCDERAQLTAAPDAGLY